MLGRDDVPTRTRYGTAYDWGGWQNVHDEVQRLRADVRALQRGPQATATADTEPETALGHDERVERENQRVARIADDLDARLRAERVDPSWSKAQETAIATTFAAPAFTGLQLDAVTCGSTMCRVGLTCSSRARANRCRGRRSHSLRGRSPAQTRSGGRTCRTARSTS